MMRDRVGPAWAIALAGVVAVALHPDAASAQRAPRVRTVEISPADAQIQVGQQQVFLANAYDAGNNPVATAVFTFTSSNSRIATVDANGIAVGVGRGTAIITARTGGGALAKSATATLSVTAAGAVVPQAAAPAAAQPVPPPAAAAPRPVPGRPTGPGYVAFDRQPAGSGPAEGLVIRPLRVVLVRGESRQLEYNAVNADGQNADRVPIIFSVAPGGEHVVSVDSVGFLRAAGDTGRATVRAEVPGNARIQPRQVAIEVRADSVRFARSELWLPVGAVDTLRVEVPAQGRTINVRGEYQFSSSDETKVRVAPLQPVVTALAPGAARIIGESPYFNVGIQVHVLRPVASFAATPADTGLTMAMSATLPIAVRALAADSSVVAEAPLRWTLPDTTIARFDTTARALHGVRAGETRLAVAAPVTRDSSIERAWRIRVVAGGLAVSRSRIGLGLGERTPVTVQLLDERRRPIGPATDLRWTSSADSVARVADGQVHGVRPGRARLTARAAWDSTVAVDAFVTGLLLAPVQRGGRWDLYTFGADSVPQLVPVTQDVAVQLEPAWAPDLTRIAYVSAPTDRPTSLDLFVANADGSEPQRLTFDSATVGSPAFAGPSGDRLVFQSNRGGTPQIYVINRDGTGRRALAAGPSPNSQPDASPDGRKVLFVSLRQFPGTPRNYDIWEMNLDGTGERRLTTSPRPEDSPSYALDGRSFYYLRDDGGSPPNKRVYRQSLADSTGGATAEPVTPAGMFVRAFSVSPDGDLLVLSRLQSVRGAGDVAQVVLFNPATGAVVPIHVGAGEQLAAPVFRPSTPQPR
jgi:Tol biopolymer transport system component